MASFDLIRVFLSGFHDSNVMIRKLKVRSLYLRLRHVTRRAILVSDRTTRARAGFRVLVSE